MSKKQGAKAKKVGQTFENIIEAACNAYKNKGIAWISKTPEPMRVIGKFNGRNFPAVFTTKAQPDFQGTLKGGQSIVFEAKHTASTNIRFDVITSEQEKDLDAHEALGAICFVLVTFSFKNYYVIDWADWKEMKRKINKLSVNERDLADYRIERTRPLDFLEGVKL